MAEERIAIYETESKIIEGDYGDFYNTISRTEAVERMARALYSKYEVRCNSDDCPNDGPNCEGCKIWKKYEEMAAAATQLTTIWPINEVKRALDLPFSDLPGGDEAPDPILNAFGGWLCIGHSTKKGR